MSSESKESSAGGPRRRRRLAIWGISVALLVPVAWAIAASLTFPGDRTPDGAYLRVVRAVNSAAPEEFFAYTEEAAQHACYTIRDYRKRSLERARAAYPAEEFQVLEARIGPLARAPDGADVFAIYAREEGWLAQMRLDLSGIDHVEVAGQRATVETSRGTRYSFRKRPNGIWGLTAFTPTLVAEAERAARDHLLIEKAASDYERSKGGASTGEVRP